MSLYKPQGWKCRKKVAAYNPEFMVLINILSFFCLGFLLCNGREKKSLRLQLHAASKKSAFSASFRQLNLEEEGERKGREKKSLQLHRASKKVPHACVVLQAAKFRGKRGEEKITSASASNSFKKSDACVELQAAELIGKRGEKGERKKSL